MPDRPTLAVFDTRPYDRAFLDAANAAVADGPAFEPRYLEAALSAATAPLAAGCTAVCGFVHDRFDAETIGVLAAAGVKLIALRCAGFNNIDLPAAARAGITVVRVPAYSPHAVAEHTLALILGLDRKIHRAWNRVREGNFALDGLMGREIHGRAVGIVGTGEIGTVVARILTGFEATVLAHDPRENPAVTAMGGRYVPLETLLAEAEIVTLHCPLTPATRHLIRKERLALMRDGALLVNTGRGALIDARDWRGAQSGRWRVALDVYRGGSAVRAPLATSSPTMCRAAVDVPNVDTGHLRSPGRRCARSPGAVGNVRRWREEPPLREVRWRNSARLDASAFRPPGEDLAGVAVGARPRRRSSPPPPAARPAGPSPG